MPFALLIIGSFLLVSAVRDKTDDLFTLVKSDFTDGKFGYWIVVILIVGSVGYVEKLKPISDGFLVLILVVLLLSGGNPQQAGFFSKFTSAIGSIGNTTQPTQSTATNSALTVPTLPTLPSLGVA